MFCVTHFIQPIHYFHVLCKQKVETSHSKKGGISATELEDDGMGRWRYFRPMKRKKWRRTFLATAPENGREWWAMLRWRWRWILGPGIMLVPKASIATELRVESSDILRHSSTRVWFPDWQRHWSSEYFNTGGEWHARFINGRKMEPDEQQHPLFGRRSSQPSERASERWREGRKEGGREMAEKKQSHGTVSEWVSGSVSESGSRVKSIRQRERTCSGPLASARNSMPLKVEGPSYVYVEKP